MTLAQNPLSRPLLISIEFFIVTLVCHLCLANSFSLYMYGAAYFITISLFLQKDQSLININSLLPLVLSIFIEHPDSASMHESQILKSSTKLFLLLKYRVQVFWVCLHIKIVAYTPPDWDSGSWGPQKSACIFSSFSVINIIVLFCFII